MQKNRNVTKNSNQNNKDVMKVISFLDTAGFSSVQEISEGAGLDDISSLRIVNLLDNEHVLVMSVRPLNHEEKPSCYYRIQKKEVYNEK